MKEYGGRKQIRTREWEMESRSDKGTGDGKQVLDKRMEDEKANNLLREKQPAILKEGKDT